MAADPRALLKWRAAEPSGPCSSCGRSEHVAATPANSKMPSSRSAPAARKRPRANSRSILPVLNRNSRSRLDHERSWPRPQAPTLLMRLRFGTPIGDGRPVGRPPDTGEEGGFGKILTGCHQASVAAAVRLSTAFDSTLGAHLVHESDQGRRRVRGPRTNPPKNDDLIVEHPCHRISGVGNHSVYDFGRSISGPF